VVSLTLYGIPFSLSVTACLLAALRRERGERVETHLLESITSVDHKDVFCYGIRGRGVESRSLMTSVETRDLSG